LCHTAFIHHHQHTLDHHLSHISQPNNHPQEYGTTRYTFPDVDLFGEGITGSHGSSGLSSLGGSLRLAELVPGGVHPVINLNSLEENSLGLEIDPALILAHALQDYGAFVVVETNLPTRDFLSQV
jgi:hypothetical protein